MRLNKLNYNNTYAFDFETTGKANYDKEDCVRVYSWGLARFNNEENNYWQGNTIEEFWKLISNPKGIIKGNHIILYAHNLKFDSSFIAYYITKVLNYTPIVQEVNKENEEELFKSHTYYCMRNESTLFAYHIKVSEKRVITLLDSMNLIPGSLETIAKNFELTFDNGQPLRKIQGYDYYGFRDFDYKLTEEELEYQRNDVLIVVKAIKKLLEITKGFVAYTTAGLAKKIFRDMNQGSYDSEHELGPLHSKFLNKPITTPNKFRYDNCFVKLPTDLWRFFKQGYSGGWVYLNEEQEDIAIKRGRLIREDFRFVGASIDVKSMYPHIMISRELPYGKPLISKGYVKTTYDRPLAIYEITFNSLVLKKGYKPIFRNNQVFATDGKRYSGNTYFTEIGAGRIVLTNVEYDYVINNYDFINLNVEKSFLFKAIRGIFDQYIGHFYKIKETSYGALKAIAKLFLNALYGKFGEGLDNATYNWLEENGTVVPRKVCESEDDCGEFIPLAIFITAYARRNIIEMSNMLGDLHIYSDTDSIKFKYYYNNPQEVLDFLKEKGIVVGKELGCMELEHLITDYKFLRAKTYAYNYCTMKDLDNPKPKICGCGIGKETQIKLEKVIESGNDGYDKFEIGMELVNLKFQYVKGGMLLLEKDMKLKPKNRF